MSSEIKPGKITYVSNTDQVIINISEDKLKLKITNFKRNVSNLYNWTLPLGFLISLVLTLCTADFKSVFGIPKEDIKVFFVIPTIIMALWFIFSGIKSLYILIKKENDLQTLIDKIKSEK